MIADHSSAPSAIVGPCSVMKNSKEEKGFYVAKSVTK